MSGDVPEKLTQCGWTVEQNGRDRSGPKAGPAHGSGRLSEGRTLGTERAGCVLEAPGGKRRTGLPTPPAGPARWMCFKCRAGCRPCRGCLRHCVEKDSETRRKTCSVWQCPPWVKGGDRGCPEGFPFVDYEETTGWGWGEGPLDSTQGLATPGPVSVALLDMLESPCQLRFVSSASLPGLSCLFGLTHLITAIPTPQLPRVQTFQGVAAGLSAFHTSPIALTATQEAQRG